MGNEPRESGNTSGEKGSPRYQKVGGRPAQMNSQMNCSALDTSAAESNTVKIPARRRATRRRHQRGRKQVICADPSGDTGSGSCVDTQVQAATGNRSATNLARTKPLGGLPRRTGQHGRCPGATCSVRVSSGSADTVFGRVTPSPPTHYRNRLMKVHVVDGQGRVLATGEASLPTTATPGGTTACRLTGESVVS